MGLEQTQMLATMFDGITRHSPEGLWFRRQAQAEGFKAAVEWRDGGRPIPEGDEARELAAELEKRMRAPAGRLTRAPACGEASCSRRQARAGRDLPVLLDRQRRSRPAPRAPRATRSACRPRAPRRRARARRSHGSSRSIVQWKLCGLTTLTSTTLTARPSSRPSSAPAAVQTAPSPATTASTCAPRQAEVREQAELLAPRQHLRREAGGDAEQADRDRHRLQPVGDGEAAVEDAQRGRADLARSTRTRAGAVVPSSPASARSAACTSPASAPARSHSARSLTRWSPVEAPVVVGASIATAPNWRA